MSQMEKTSGGNNPKDAPATLPKGEKPNVDPSELPDNGGVEMRIYRPTVAWVTIPALLLFILFVVVGP